MRTETETVKSNGESLTIRSLLQPSVSGVAVSLLVSWLTVDILSTFCGVFMIQRVKLMLCEYYGTEAEDNRSCLLNCCAKN